MGQQRQNMNANAHLVGGQAIALPADDEALGSINPVAVVLAMTIAFVALFALGTAAGLSWPVAVLSGWVGSFALMIASALAVESGIAVEIPRDRRV